MFEQEFNDQVDAVDLLTKTERKILNWIKENQNQTEFTTKEISEKMEMDQDNIRTYLSRMVEGEVLKSRKQGSKNLYQLISGVWTPKLTTPRLIYWECSIIDRYEFPLILSEDRGRSQRMP